MQYINKLFGKNFKFHSNFNILKYTLYFLSFYKEIPKLWGKYYWKQPPLPSTIVSQYLWFNSFIKIDNKVVFHRKFLEININFVTDLIKQNGKFKTWEQITHESTFWDLTLPGKHIYPLLCITTIDSMCQCFQYKILTNTLYLNQKLFLFRKHKTSLCYFVI